MNLFQSVVRTLVYLVLAVFLFPVAVAQTLSYRAVEVGGRVKITVPAHWRVRDLAERQNIAAAADAALSPSGSTDTMHVSALSVVSQPEPIRAIIRVSFIQDTGSQADLIRQVKVNKAQVVADFRSSWETELEVTKTAMSKQGVQYLGQERFDTESVGGKMALVLSYKRSSVTGGSPFVVSQYHIPLGNDKVLVTLSYQESHAFLFSPILERIKNSLVISR